ncbi:cellulose binding domain-containing protein [Phytomonospora sp. NPDC050363]|uniref:cellulose binding domain-containing protein n=1 Tax=Phytomonospora sp. NPDC050363 TaxID=3155642 RepID=UPI003408746F
MFRRSLLLTLLAVALAALTLVLVRPAEAAAPVRVMPLGDSITAGPGCWRALLWDRLRTGGHTDVDFVGGVADGGGCNYGFGYDGDHEGHSGLAATTLASNGQLPSWLAAARPDVVVMHLGTNDMWGGWIPTDDVVGAFTTLVGQMRAHNPAMRIVVAQIIPMHGCDTCPADAVALNERIPAWAAGLTTAASPITVVDQWSGFDVAADTYDGVHPTDSGFRKMADRFHPAVAAALGGVTPTPTGSPSPTSTPSPTPAAGCTAAYRVVSQWGGGFQAEVSVRNSSARAISGWTVGLVFADGQQVTQSWNTRLTQSGTTVTAGNVAYNGTLAPGTSTAFGLIANWTGANTPPTLVCTGS